MSLLYSKAACCVRSRVASGPPQSLSTSTRQHLLSYFNTRNSLSSSTLQPLRRGRLSWAPLPLIPLSWVRGQHRTLMKSWPLSRYIAGISSKDKDKSYTCFYNKQRQKQFRLHDLTIEPTLRYLSYGNSNREEHTEEENKTIEKRMT